MGDDGNPSSSHVRSNNADDQYDNDVSIPQSPSDLSVAASKIQNLKFVNATSYALTLVVVLGVVLAGARAGGIYGDEFLWMKYQVSRSCLLEVLRATSSSSAVCACMHRSVRIEEWIAGELYGNLAT